jgi:hypothetical protein
MKADGSNDAPTEANMFMMPITRRVTVLNRILRNSFVIQQNAEQRPAARRGHIHALLRNEESRMGLAELLR